MRRAAIRRSGVGTAWRGALALGVGALLLPAVPLAGQQQPVIDMHLHTHMPPESHVHAGAPSICRPDPCRGWGQASADADETFRRTLAQMDRHNVVLGFLSGLDLETVQKWDAAAPGRFIPAVFILEPGHPPAEALRREYTAGRLRGMGEIGTQLTGFAPNDPALEPYFALAEELDVPVLVHTLGIGPYLPGFRSAAGNPLLLEDVLTRHPDLRIYIENAGFPYLEETIAMMYQYPQLHGDLSTISWIIPRQTFHDYLEGLVRAGLGKRLMFGSDQMRWPESIGRAIEGIETAEFLSETQKRDIFYNNAARFLRLDSAVSGSGGS
ncbi:MAG: amidohydrolase family protein [Longimicrobiales bacterium]